MNRWFLTISGVVIILSIFLYSGASVNSLFDVLYDISFEYLLVFSAIVFIQILGLTGRWKLVVAVMTKNITFRKGYFFYITNVSLLAAALISTLFGSAGSRVLSLRLEYGVRVIDASTAAISDLAVGFFTIILMGFPALFYYLGGISLGLSIGLSVLIILLISIVFIKQSGLLFALIGRSFNFYLGVINKFGTIRKFLATKEVSLEAASPLGEKRSALLLVYSLTAYICNVIAFWLILKMIGIEVQFLEFLVIFPIIALLSTISPTPGGLGTTDAVWFVVLLSHGTPDAQAGQFILLRRVIYDGVIVCVATFAYLYYANIKK